MGFTRSVYELTSGFNEKLLVAEDDDFAWQLKKLDVFNAVVPTAVMQMDLGNRKRRLVRSWRYGKGITRLLKVHPDLRMQRLKQNPDIWLYPILLPIYLGILVLAIWKPVFLFAPLLISSALVLRNFKSKTKLFDHVSHFIYACGSIWEGFKSLFKSSRHGTVVQFPHDQSAYLNFLSDSLNSSHPVSIKFPELTKSASLNVFLLPFLTPVMRIFGIRLINIHWIVGKWQLTWASRPWGRQILWYWFQVWLFSFKCFGIKIIYTVHDVKFHAKVFNNDNKTQKYLMEKADALVFLNDLSKEKILKVQPKKIHALIAEGPLDLETSITRGEMRRRLGVSDSKILLVLVGHLLAYKGIDLLFPAAEIMPENFAIRIAGVCMGEYHVELEALAARAQELGLDIKLEARGLNDEDFSAYLYCADYFIYPCRDINNSGSLNAALTANLPVIVPDMPELSWVLPECKVVMQKTSEATLDFNECFERILNMTPAQYQDLKNGTLLWKSERSWAKVSDQYTKLYRELLNE
jgi:glycosyltransferase involved in cell wall biosynthesis